MRNKIVLRITSTAAAALICAVWSLAGCSPQSTGFGDEKNDSPELVPLTALSMTVGGAELIPNFSAGEYSYSYNHETAGDEPMTVRAEAEAEVTVSIFIKDKQEAAGAGMAEAAFKAPKAGTSALTIKIVTEKPGISPGEYLISVIPRQQTSLDNYYLSQLSVSYTESSRSLLTPAFSQGTKEYSVNARGSDSANQGKVFVKAKAASSESTVKIFDADTTRKASEKGEASATIDLTPLGTSKVIIVEVTRGDGNGSSEYEITLNHVAAIYTWRGTVRYDNADKVISAITVLDTIKSNKTSAIIDRESDVSGTGLFNYTFEMSQLHTPKYFVVTLLEAGKAESESPKKFETGRLEPVVGTHTELIEEIFINSTQIGNRIENAIEFMHYLGAGGAGSTENYTLASNIDLAGYKENGVTVDWTGPSNYKGTLFGNGKTISGLVLKRASGTNDVTIGLFKSLGDDAVLQDFTLEVAADEYYKTHDINGFYFGGIVGQTTGTGSTLKNITVTGDLEFYNIGSFVNLGGFIGVSAVNVKIEYCVSNLNVLVTNGTDSNSTGSFGIGGFVGTITNGGVSITDSYANGSFIITMGANRHMNVGGFIGWTYNNGMANVNIKNSCYSGDIVFDSSSRTTFSNSDRIASVGGFVGWKALGQDIITITNSAVLSEKMLSTGPSGKEAYSNSGRMIGRVTTSGTVVAPPVFTNNIARIDMLTGYDPQPVTLPSDAGGPDTAAGKGLSLAELQQKTTWTGTLGWSEDIWDFSGLSQGIWPTLKQVK